MVNESIRIGMERRLTSQSSFNYNVHHCLSDNMEFLKMYVRMSMLLAKSKVGDFWKLRKKNSDSKTPCYKTPYVIIDRQSYKIIGTTLPIGVIRQATYWDSAK